MGKIYVEMNELEYDKYKEFCNKEISENKLFDLITFFAAKNDFLKPEIDILKDPFARPVEIAKLTLHKNINDYCSGKIEINIRFEGISLAEIKKYSDF